MEEQSARQFSITSDCIECGNCVEPCPPKAIHSTGEQYIIDYDDCVDCGRCVEVCPVGAAIGIQPQSFVG